MLLTQAAPSGIQGIEQKLGEPSGPNGGIGLKTFSNLANVITEILPYIFAAAGAVLVIYIVMGGISLMLSQGDPKAIAVARGRITNGILGALIVVFAYLIMQLIGGLFGLSDFTNLFK